MKELIERLRNDCYQEDEVRAHAKEAADALERLTAELADVTSMYNRCVDDVHAARVERDSLKEGLDGWHSRFLDAEVERDALKEQMTADRKQFLDMRDERDALRADAKRYWLQEKPCGDIWLHAKYFSVNLGHKESTDSIYKAMQESARIDAAIGEKT